MGISRQREREGEGERERERRGCGLTWRTLVLGVLAAKGQGEPPLPAAGFLTGWSRGRRIDDASHRVEVCLRRDRVLADGRRGDHAEDK